MNNSHLIIKDENDYKIQRVDMLRRIDKEYFILRIKKALSRYDFIHITFQMLNLIYIVNNRI